ncbi:MAG: ABC transporter ATP-binding protein [Proteobacteria bacterium]|nr:ABC transporter ATP-binding protein [Pseudomonadota bacterium]
MGKALLSVDNLEVGFETDQGLARVLDHVNFDIMPGEIVGLVGESGCGKTTLARAILGVLPQNSARISAGSITFQGRNLLDVSKKDLASNVRGKLISFIPQDPLSSFNPVFTIGSQIMELMKWKSPDAPASKPFMRYNKSRQDSDKKRVLDLLKTVQLPDGEGVLRKYPHEVSGGQRQRLMIAMALLPEPRMIIADEPTTALDVTIQAQILKLLRTVSVERGVSVLFTTHDLGAAYEICDKVTVMYAGQEVESAPSSKFFSNPKHPYTIKLLQSLPSHAKDIQGIPGQIPSLTNAPTGCRFHPRCSNATPKCSGERPPITLLDNEHTLRCFNSDTVSNSEETT